jgi:hypothetical protein
LISRVILVVLFSVELLVITELVPRHTPHRYINIKAWVYNIFGDCMK